MLIARLVIRRNSEVTPSKSVDPAASHSHHSQWFSDQRVVKGTTTVYLVGRMLSFGVQEVHVYKLLLGVTV